jgi:hypothetical protein
LKGIYGLARDHTPDNTADFAARTAQRADSHCKQHDYD